MFESSSITIKRNSVPFSKYDARVPLFYKMMFDPSLCKSNPKVFGYNFKKIDLPTLNLSFDTCLNFSIAFTKVFRYSRLFFSSSVVRATHSKSNKRRDVVKVTVAPKSCFDTNTREFFIEKRWSTIEKAASHFASLSLFPVFESGVSLWKRANNT